MVFGNQRRYWIAVDGSGRREHEFSNSMCAQCFEHGSSAGNIDVKKDARVSYRFRYQGLGCKVKHDIVFFLGENGGEPGPVSNIEPIKGDACGYCLRMSG